MATVRDTEQTIAFLEGREVLDPTALSHVDWVAIIDSAVSVADPKHLHGFRAAQDIAGKPVDDEVAYTYHVPPARIWLGRPSTSWEFKWHFQYLVCGIRSGSDVVDDVSTLTYEYLLLSKSSEFFILTTTWKWRDGSYHFSNNTKDGYLKVHQTNTLGVVSWCDDDHKSRPYLLRTIVEKLFSAAEETEKDLRGKLEYAARQRQDLGNRLSSISWVKPGDTVYFVYHTHSWDRVNNNEYHCGSATVTKVENGLAYIDAEHEPIPLRDCYKTLRECDVARPANHPDS